MTDLDNPQLFRDTDPEDMLARISELPRQCRDAWANAQSLQLPAEYRQAEAVVILGMGGSALGGGIAAWGKGVEGEGGGFVGSRINKKKKRKNNTDADASRTNTERM